MTNVIGDAALDAIFRTARTHRRWTDQPVSDAMLMAVYDLMRWGPTSGNITPARIVFVTSPDGKARLRPYLDAGNVEKTMTAPATAIIGHDLDFPVTLPQLSPQMVHAYDGKPDLVAADAMRNGTLQGAYFIIAARALGLDCGPMGGFDRDGVDREFFAGTQIRSNFLCNIGHGDPAAPRPRAARLSFDQACRII